MIDIVERLRENWTMQWVLGEHVDTDTELSGLLHNAAEEDLLHQSKQHCFDCSQWMSTEQAEEALSQRKE